MTNLFTSCTFQETIPFCDSWHFSTQDTLSM